MKTAGTVTIPAVYFPFNGSHNLFHFFRILNMSWHRESFYPPPDETSNIGLEYYQNILMLVVVLIIIE
jgi:hypothetical protein